MQSLSFLLFPLMAFLLVSGQAFWNSAIKNENLLKGSPLQIAGNLLSSSKIWAGAIIYIAATVVYFILLSRNKFFVVQITMTALAIIFSTFLAALLFNEKIGLINIFGAALVLVGLSFVLIR
jgi:hypothetical protein